MSDTITAPITIVTQSLTSTIGGVSQPISAPLSEYFNNAPGFIPTEQATATTPLSGHMVVVLFNGTATYANRLTDYNSRLGITNGAVVAGDQATVTLWGPMVEPSWNFVNGPVFVGDGGLLTQTAPTGGPIIRAGIAVSATKLIVDFQQPIAR